MEKKSIYAKIIKVMDQVSRVPKNGFNDFHKYSYATEADLVDTIRPLLVETGLSYFATVKDVVREGELTRVQMDFVLADTETGETLTSCYYGEALDKGDKGIYKAYTGATKYFLMKTFLIATGDDPEADHGDNRNQTQGQKPTQPVRDTSRQQRTSSTPPVRKASDQADSYLEKIKRLAILLNMTPNDLGAFIRAKYRRSYKELKLEEQEEVLQHLQSLYGKGA